MIISHKFCAISKFFNGNKLAIKCSISRRKCTLTSNLFQPQQDLGHNSNEIVSRSHKLLTSYGLVDNTPTGVILLPYLVRSLEKLIKIIDEEMDAIGAQKIIMPSLAPIRLLEQSGRWEWYKNDVYTVEDDMLLSPTHEEVITKLIAKKSNRYKYPLRLYQITTKYRKEKRVRSGLLRAREFLMKDLYSFDTGFESGVETYQTVCKSYERIFERLNLPVIKVEADPGDMGGQFSHEYQLLCDAGQDDIMICSDCGHCFNQELLFETIEKERDEMQSGSNGENKLEEKERRNNEEQTNQRSKESESKLKKEEEREKENKKQIKCLKCGSESIESRKGIEVGHTFLLGTRYTQPFDAHYNLTSSSSSLPSSSSSEDSGEGGSSSSRSLSPSSSPGGEIGKKEFLTMGSYGVGVTRLLASSLEVLSNKDTNDRKNMKWPLKIAPFDVVVILPKAGSNEERVIGSEFGIKFATYISQVSNGVLDVLIDDRTDKSIGKRDKNHILVGIPIRIILGKSVLENIPKFEVVSTYENEDGEERRKFLTHSEVIHYFRILSMN